MEASLKKVIFTCGGTAGHVNPAIALAQLMREKDPETEFLFVGAERGLEKDLIPKAGYDFRTVHISSFHRSFKPREMRHNLVSVGNLLRAPGEARAILRQFRPDVVIGTGGYASFPMVKAAAKAGIPTAVHESNMVPGLTTEMLEPFADRIMVGFEACREHYRHPGEGDRHRYAGAAGLLPSDEGRGQAPPGRGRRPAPACVLLGVPGGLGHEPADGGLPGAGGGQGTFPPHPRRAERMAIRVLLKLLREKGVDLADHPALQVREYIYDMAAVMRAADLVLCRAGASTISELTALGVPALIVPSPYVTNNHQEKNARVLENAGGAAVLLEKDCSGQALFQAACGICWHDGARRAAMERAMSGAGNPGTPRANLSDRAGNHAQ